MRKKQMRIIGIVAAVVILLVVGVIAVNNYGSSQDPLVSMSYITDNLTPTLQSKFTAQIDSKADELRQDFVNTVSTTNGGFTAISLSAGQKLTCSAGTEILLVSGSVQAVNEGYVSDVTSGEGMAADASLTANHLYIVTSDGIAVSAANSAQVMVRGTATASK